MSGLLFESPVCGGHCNTFLTFRLNEGLLLGAVTDRKCWKPEELDGVLVNVIDGGRLLWGGAAVIDGPSTTRVVYSESP